MLDLTKEEKNGALKLRKQRIILVVLFILYLPYGILIDSIFDSEKAELTFIATYFFLIVIIAARYSFSKCPRCQNIFTWKGLYANAFTNKCLHCGLSILKSDLIKKN